MIEKLILLYINFFKIGAFSFGGGYAVLPLIQKYLVDDLHWLTIKELTDLVSLSQVTPGPIAINAATFIGSKISSLAGAIVATTAEVTPSCILMLCLGHFIFKGKKIDFLDKALKGLKAAIPALILIAGINMFKSSILSPKGVNYLGLAGFVLGGFFFTFKRIDIIKIIIASAGLGIILHFISFF